MERQRRMNRRETSSYFKSKGNKMTDKMKDELQVSPSLSNQKN